MRTLPWYVVHGLAVGWLVAVAIVALVCWLVFLGSARRLSRSSAKLRSMFSPVTPPSWRDGERTAIVGTLKAEGPLPREPGGNAPVAIATRDERSGSRSGERVVTNVRAERLDLQCGESSCELRGEVRVVTGSRATSIEGGLRSLQPGDRVIAEGTLRRIEGGDRPEYRGSDVGWILEGDGESPVTAAHDGAPRFRPPLAGQLVRGILAGVMVAPIALWVIGAMGLRYDANPLAMISPFSRERALLSLRGDVQRDETLGARRRLDELVALNQLLHDCEGEAEVLFDHGQLGAAAERFSQCGSHETSVRAAQAWSMIGEFGKASAAYDRAETFPPPPPPPAGILRPLEDPRQVATIHLMARRFGPAAAALRRFVPGLPGVYVSSVSDVDVYVVAHCLADALDARNGDEAASRSLASQTTDECRLLYADLLPGDKRLGTPLSTKRRQDVALLLVAEAGGTSQVHFEPIPLPDPTNTPLEVLESPCYVWPTGLELGVLASLQKQAEPARDDRAMRAHLATNAAIRELSWGDPAAARRWAELAVTDAARLLPNNQMQAVLQRLAAAGLQAIVAVRAGDLPTASKVIEPWRAAGDSTWSTLAGLDPPVPPAEWELPYYADIVGPRVDDLLVFEFVAQGASTKTAQPARKFDLDRAKETLEELAALRAGTWAPKGYQFASLGALFLGVQGDVPQRETISEWLEVGRWPRRGGLCSRMNESAILADVASRIGNEPFAADQRAIAARIRQAISSRDIAVPLAILESLE